jgi:O-antigen/teichoic acid export membrane protein
MHARVIAHNTVLNLAGRIVSGGVFLLVTPYIIHRLGADGYGILSIAWLALAYFGVLDLGMSGALIKYVAEYLNPLQPERIRVLFWSALSAQVLLGLVGGAAAAALVPLATDKLFRIPLMWAMDARASFYILALAIPVLLASNIFRAALEAAQRFDFINAVRVPTSVATNLLAALAVYWGYGVAGIVLMLLVMRLVTTVLYWRLCVAEYPFLGRPAFSASALGQVVRFGGWLVVSSAASSLFGYLERFLIPALLSVAALAYYAAPFELTTRLTVLPACIAPTLFPFFSYHGSKDRAAVADASLRALKFLLFLLTPVVSILVFFAYPILLLWLGRAFAEKGSVVLQLLAVGFLLNCLASVPLNSVQGLGKPNWKAMLDVAALPVYAGTCWILISRMGIDGAALAKLIVTVIDVISLFWFAWRLNALPSMGLSARALSRGLAVCGGLALLVYVVRMLSAALPYVALMLAGVLLAYCVALWTLAVDEKEKKVLLDVPRFLLLRARSVEGA